MITEWQIRAARAAIGWTQKELAEAADVSQVSIKRIEKEGGIQSTRAVTLDRIQRALEKEGIHFDEPDRNDGSPWRGVRRFDADQAFGDLRRDDHRQHLID